jgi:hypothetical protein
MRGQLPPLEGAYHPSSRMMVELGMPDLGFCATPVVPETGGKTREKSPSSGCRRPRLVRGDSRSSRRNSPPSIDFPLPSGQGEEHRSHNSMPYVAPPVASVMSRSATICFRHRLIRSIPPVSSPCGLHRLYGRCAIAITLAHRMRHSCRWWVPTRGEVGWKSHIGAPTSKVPGTDVLTEALRTRFFRGRPI